MTRIVLGLIIVLIIISSCTEDNTTEANKNSIITGTINIQIINTNSDGIKIKTDIDNLSDSMMIILTKNLPVDTTYTQDGKYIFMNLESGNYRCQAYITDKINKNSSTKSVSGTDSISFDFIQFATYGDNNLMLNNIYPNPLTGPTKILFTLVKSAELDLKIYNLKGEVVKTILTKTLLDAGQFTESLNSDELTPGTYAVLASTKENYSYYFIKKN